MKYFFSDKTKDYLFLLLVAVIAYWPVSFMLFSVKNDAINYFLAMRYNTSEAIQYNYFPSWSAYINMGYPLHADMQSGVWNPLVFLMSLIRKYDIYWLHIETIITILLSGISMYHLLKYFKLQRMVVLTVSAAYMMNGYITDAGQFLNWLYAAAILPFVFLSAIKCFTSFKVRDAFLLGLAHSFMLLCSYPADFILLSYILAAFAIFSFYRHRKEKKLTGLFKKFSLQIIIAIATFSIICLPAILSYIPFINSIPRGSGVALETALSNSLAPANLISIFTPWATQRGDAFAETDPLIRNCYMGIILFIFFIYFILQNNPKTYIQKFLGVLFIVFMIFSLGKFAGLRALTFNFLPLMNTFRHPANAKLFFIFAGQILAAFAINEYTLNNSFNKRLLKRITAVTLIIVSCALLISIINSNILTVVKATIFSEGNSIANQVKAIKDNFSFFDLLFLNSFFVFLVLIFFYRTIQANQVKNYFFLLILIDMFVTAQGMLPLTYVRKSSPVIVQDILDQQPKGYPLPNSDSSINSYSANGMRYFDQLGCLNPYNKKPGRSDYIISPANLGTQEYFWDYITFREKVVQYPLAYFADTIYSTRDTAAFIASISLKKVAITDAIPAMNTVNSPRNSGRIFFKKFVPGSFTIETESSNQEFLVVLQNKYYNWTTYVNGEKTQIIKTNLSFMGVVLPPGKNNVQFIYETRVIQYLGIFSIFFIGSGLFIFFRTKKKI